MMDMIPFFFVYTDCALKCLNVLYICTYGPADLIFI